MKKTFPKSIAHNTKSEIRVITNPKQMLLFILCKQVIPNANDRKFGLSSN